MLALDRGYIPSQQVRRLGRSPVIPDPLQSGGVERPRGGGLRKYGSRYEERIRVEHRDGGSGSDAEAKYSRRLIALH